MRNDCLKALLPILSITAWGHADQASSGPSKEPRFIEYHNRVVLFNPLHQAYERIKPNAFYAGVEGYWIPVLGEGKHDSFLDIELRMGYNFFFNERDHLTPFVGAGFQCFSKHHHTNYVYGAAGLLYDHEFNTIFNLGLKAQLLMGNAHERLRKDIFVIGTDVSLPITFRFGHKRHWDYRIEPFNIYLHGAGETQSCFWGFRNTLGYRF